MKVSIYLKLATLSVAFTLTVLTARAQTGFFEAAPQLRLGDDLNSHIKKLSFYRLKETDLRTYMLKAPLEFKNQGSAIALQIPLPNGSVETFDMLESPVLSPEVAAKHPEIKTYKGRGQAHKNYTIRISFTAIGFNAIILGVEGDAVYFDKATTSKTDQLYRTYFARDAERPKPTKAFGQIISTKCGTDESNVPTTKSQNTNKGARPIGTLNNSGTVLRTFRLAMAADGEFTAHKGGNVPDAFAALVGYVSRVNAVYEVELSVHFNLVTTETAVYSNTTTYNNDSQSGMLAQNQANLDALIGNASYDIGHVLGYAGSSGGGIASLGVICDDTRKGRGVSGVGDGTYASVFDDQLVTHEMGHQFSMTHSYNSSIPVCTTREPGTSVEPGSGATIMSYGFTCSDGDLNGGDDYEQPAYAPFLTFHSTNYDQAEGLIATTSCYSTTILTNAVPVVAMPINRTIPKSTPFTLTGTAMDADAGNALTYSWEGMNIGTMTPTVTTLSDTTQPPFFRSYQPISTGMRTFPRLSAILNGTNHAIGDKLPAVGIVTTNRLTVRDGVGGLSYGEMTVTIDATSGPFLETTNLSGVYLQNTAKTITWDVANTTAAPVSSPNVDILLSTDGGQSFTTVLASNTPNDGSQSITLPNVVTTQARIKIASSNNIFFDISNSNFTITDVVPDLAALLYVLPSTTYGTSNVTAVVNVIELNSVPTSGTVTAYVTKDPWVPFTFNPAATSVGGRAVSNGAWSFDGVNNPDFYVLTTTQVIGAGGTLSFGLDVVFNPGTTKGSMSVSSMVIVGGEAKTDNNSDAEKIDYFNK